MTATFDLIEEKILTSDTANISFTGLPSQYNKFTVFISGSGAGSAMSLYLRINNDTTSYQFSTLRGTAGSSDAQSEINGSQLNLFRSLTLDSSTNFGAYLDLEYHPQTDSIALTAISGSPAGIVLTGGHGTSFTSLNSIDFTTLAQGLDTGSRIALYGQVQ